MKNKLIYLILFILMSVNGLALISDNFTALDSDSSIIDYAFAFNTSLNNLVVYSVLWGMLIVATMSIYFWKQDFIDSFIVGLIIISFIGFLLTLIKNDAGVRLLTFDQETVFIVLLSLTSIYKRWSDK